MPKFILRRLVPIAAVLALSYPACAQDAFDLSVPKADEAAEGLANLECAAEPISGSGPGFTSSRDDAEEAAITSWMEKAKAIYPEATWEIAKDSNLSCAVQGLYSKCFADGTPCKPKAE